MRTLSKEEAVKLFEAAKKEEELEGSFSFDDMYNLALFAKAKRLEKGIRLQDIEDLTGLANGNLSRIERGITVNPSFDVMKYLFEALGYKLSMKLEKI